MMKLVIILVILLVISFPAN
ncbi:type I toxin-antitoxin system Ibs family toxin [Salmonella enterica subsp. enterica serovar Ceyco]|nr:type I toxin-antitoxin system Ibs family toxin [Salmonella enterica subsp. enterica serovar Ceyco]